MKQKKKLDLATLVGFVLGFGSIIISVLIEKSSLGSYVNLSAAILVFGGSLGAALVSCPMLEARRLPAIFLLVFREHARDGYALIDVIIKLAERSRREGMLALEQETEAIQDPLLKKGVMLVVDGTDGELVRDIMEIDISARAARHEAGITLFEALGGFAPTLGILGTVMGMIRILAHMTNANELGSAIAVAFTATLYGVGSANLLWLPIANKLKRRTALEEEISHLVLDGIMGIQEGDNPAVLREKLNGYFLPQKARKKVEQNAPAAVAGGGSSAAAAR